MLDRATVFGGWWEPYGKSRLQGRARRLFLAAVITSREATFALYGAYRLARVDPRGLVYYFDAMRDPAG